MILLLAAATAGCGEGERTEQGGLATTTSAAVEPPPPTGPLDELVVERIGELELERHAGAPQVREVGAEDARDLTYSSEAGEAVLTLARFPAPRRARAYARQFASVLRSDTDLRADGRPRALEGELGEGELVELDDRAGTVALVWSTGPVFVSVLADPEAAEAILAQAPYGGTVAPAG